jgi:mRNA-degrading endonuclease RelE of RelBE toxin-antitoxin system
VKDDVLFLGKREREAVKAKIEWLSEHADEISHQGLHGKALRTKFKLRVGDIRVIYSLDRKNKLLYIELIGHRSKIYKER